MITLDAPEGLQSSFARSLQEVVSQFRATIIKNEPFIEQIRAQVLAVVETALPKFQELGEMVARIDALVERWDNEAPGAVKEAISARGLIVPLSQLSLPDLSELLEIHRDRGVVAVADRIAAHYDEMFGQAEFLECLTAEWATRKALSRRLPLLLEAVRAHELRMYAVSVPALIAQFEGLVADLAGHVGMMNHSDMKKHVAKIAEQTGSGDVLNEFISEALLAKFAHGSLVPPFSRHAILHGGDIAYATERNSRTAILLIDEISQFEL